MRNGVKAVPDGFHTITPHLIVKGASQALEFYKKAFGGIELTRHAMPDGRLMHSMMRIGDSFFFVVDEFPEMGPCRSPLSLGGSPVSLHLYVDDCDALFNQAVAAGATVEMPLMNMFWGDRFGKLKDPFGHEWSIGSHVEDVTPADMEQRAKAAVA
jgi:uncharacterized glyoxalase superfamily protein PhnB